MRMTIYLGNLLGPLSNNYQFADGSTIRRSSSESLLYDGAGRMIHIQFYRNPPHGYEYEIPKKIQGEERVALVEKIELYCKKKNLRPVRSI
ncbi:hypothetical protein AC630_22115 [Bradyrhizobium sp. AS23.2]|nr:hypothetical protein AC630_22115 [Bradyrhizobium sp. AS23.2]